MNDRLLQARPLNLFFTYLIPALVSTVFINIYIITDTAMIGQGVGGLGLVGLNLVLPLYNSFFALGYLYGNGGSILYSIRRGSRKSAGDRAQGSGSARHAESDDRAQGCSGSAGHAESDDRAQGSGSARHAGEEHRYDQREVAIFSTAVVMLFASGILLTVVLSIWLVPVLRLLGADEETMSTAYAYARPLMFFLTVFLLNPFIQTFVRNDSDPSLPMIGSMVGCAVNIFLDWHFIFPLHGGLGGAVWATIIGYSINTLITCLHFFKKSCELRFSFKAFSPRLIIPILQNGCAGFMTEIAAGVVIIAFNRQLLALIGSSGVVIFSVNSNTAIVAHSLLTGVGSALQPILSTNFGARLKERIRSIIQIGVLATLIMAFVIYAAIYIGSHALIYLFVNEAENYLSMAYCIRIYFIELFAFGFNQFSATSLQALGQPFGAFLISLERSFVFSLALILVLPLVFGAEAIWWAAPATEFLTLLSAVVILLRAREVYR